MDLEKLQTVEHQVFWLLLRKSRNILNKLRQLPEDLAAVTIASSSSFIVFSDLLTS
jgi:hypothetical protein